MTERLGGTLMRWQQVLAFLTGVVTAALYAGVAVWAYAGIAI